MKELVEDYPRTLAELEARFSSEEACREYLFRLRWPEGFCCSRCHETKAWPLRTGRWQCASCGHQMSVDGGDNFSRYANSADGLVSCYVVGDQSEEWSQRLGATASLGLGELPDGLGLAAQIAAGHGKARTGSTLGTGRGR